MKTNKDILVYTSMNENM